MCASSNYQRPLHQAPPQAFLGIASEFTEFVEKTMEAEHELPADDFFVGWPADEQALLF